MNTIKQMQKLWSSNFYIYLAMVVLMNTSVFYLILCGDEVSSLLLVCSWFWVLRVFFITCMRSAQEKCKKKSPQLPELCVGL